MARVQLLHWKPEEADAYVSLLEAAGHEVNPISKFQPGLMRTWRESPPDAFVIDLSRLPSHGREVAGFLRHSRGTRRTPIVFCEGTEDKVARVRAELPDATYCGLRTLRSALRRALRTGLKAPVVPQQMMQRYAGRSAAEKLGIKERSAIALVDAPRNFSEILGRLPKSVRFYEDSFEKSDIALCFVRNAGLLQERLSELRSSAARTKIWVLWRKGGSAARGEMTEQFIRECGIQLGLVDYKVCSVNEIWSALAFARMR